MDSAAPAIENDQKWLYHLLPIKYELPSEVVPGLLPFKSRSKQCIFRAPREILTRFPGSILVSTYLHNGSKRFLKEQSYFFHLIPVYFGILLP